MKKKLIIAFLLISIVLLYAQEYKMEFIKSFENGSGVNGLLYGDRFAEPDDTKGPNGMAFDRDGRLHILDTWNERIVIYSENLSVEKIVNVSKGHINILANGFWLTPRGYLSIAGFNRFSLVSYSGELIFNYNFQVNELRQELTSDYDQIVYNGYLFKRTVNNRLFCVLPSKNVNKENIGTILWDDDVHAMFEDDSAYDMGNLTLDENGFFYLNGELYTQDYRVFVRYWMKERNISDIQIFRNEAGHSSKPFHINAPNVDFCGQDHDGNIYWDVMNKWITIFNNRGFIIGKIEFDGDQSSITPAVSPLGDLYFLDSSKEGHSLYRIKRNW